MLHTRLQAIFNVNYKHNLERILHELIVTYALDAERLAPLSFDRCINDVITSVMNEGKRSVTCSDDIRCAFSADINEMIKMCVLDDHQVYEMLCTAITLAGFGGKIIVERALNMPHVEQRVGYTFSVNPVFITTTQLKFSKIVCIDGIIENVSEIHHLLEQASETCETCVMFVRGASDDVKHTLKVNADRGTLRISLVIVPFDLQGANTLVDIAVVSGCDVVSSLKGDLISTIDFKSLPSVQRVDMLQQVVTIHNVKTQSAVAHHVKNLCIKRDAIKQEDLQKLINDRIRSLTSGHVVIRLSDDHRYVWRAQLIDYALRSLRSMITYGVSIVSDHAVPAMSNVVSRLYADRCLEAINDLTCVIATT